MKHRGYSVLVPVLGILAALTVPPAYGQKEYHGADSIFEAGGVAIVWAILKGPDEDHSWVYIKMIDSGIHPSPFQSYSVQAVDPFSDEKEWVVKNAEWKGENEIKARRSFFRDQTARKILFYENKVGEKPDLTVSYMGIPDTTPELLTEAQLDDYFRKAIERLKKH